MVRKQNICIGQDMTGIDREDYISAKTNSLC
jgi:hypothetical protein